MPKNEGFIWAAYLRISWPLVEEDFGFWRSDGPKNEGFEPLISGKSSPWLRKISDFDDRKCPRMKDLFEPLISEYLGHGWRKLWVLMIWNAQEFEPLMSEYLHHGWWKFWILMVSNALEWRIWTGYLRISSPWLEKALDFDDLSKNKVFEPLMTTFRRISSPWLKTIFWFWRSEMPMIKYFSKFMTLYFQSGWNNGSKLWK